MAAGVVDAGTNPQGVGLEVELEAVAAADQRRARAAGRHRHRQAAPQQPGVVAPRRQSPRCRSRRRPTRLMRRPSRSRAQQDPVPRTKPGVRTETCARQELRAEIAAMMSGEQLDIAQEPRYRTAYVNSWTNALNNGPAGGSGPRPSMRSGCPTGCSGRERDRTPMEGRADRDRAASGEPCPHNRVRSRTTRRPGTEYARA